MMKTIKGKSSFRYYMIAMTSAIILAIMVLSAFSIVESRKEFKRNVVLQAVSLTKSFRNNILLGDSREIINNHK